MNNLRMIQAPEPGTQPDYCHPPYISSLKRSPRNPLVPMPEALSRCSGPVFGQGIVGDNALVLTANDNSRSAQLFRIGRVSRDNGKSWTLQLCLFDPKNGGEVCYEKH